MEEIPKIEDCSAARSEKELSRLREAAQRHIQELEEETNAAEKEQIERREQMQRYLPGRTKCFGKDKRGDAPEQQLSQRPSKLRPVGDIIDRLRWDPEYKNKQYTVGYLERFEGLKEIPLASWVRDSTEEEWIPQHRIKYIKDAQGDIIWHRDERVDRLYKSGRGDVETFG